MSLAVEELRAAELGSPSGRLQAAFVPRAGMVGWSLRHDGDELLAHPVSLSDATVSVN